MSVILRNKTTGETKTVKVGFSWILFFFAGFFGIPLFMRRLYVWGSVFLVYWLIYAFGAHFVDNYDAAWAYIDVNLLFLGLQIWIAIKGNEMTAKNPP